MMVRSEKMEPASYLFTKPGARSDQGPIPRCKWLVYILGSDIARPQVEANARTAIGNHAIGNEDVFSIEIPNKVKAEIVAILRDTGAPI